MIDYINTERLSLRGKVHHSIWSIDNLKFPFVEVGNTFHFTLRGVLQYTVDKLFIVTLFDGVSLYYIIILPGILYYITWVLYFASWGVMIKSQLFQPHSSMVFQTRERQPCMYEEKLTKLKAQTLY